jgi:ABC-type glycerol-3-phosphate transport system substrate-binding protein
VGILNYYRNFIKKSRSFYTKHLKRRKIDILMLAAVIVVLSFIIVNRACRTGTLTMSRRIEITISPQCKDFFGSDTVDALIQEFEAHNPDLRIQETSHENADIVFFDDSELGSLINVQTDAPALASLTPYIHIEVQPEQWAARWALPLVSFMDLLVYNIDILQAADCDRPPKTRAEFLAAARAVAKSNSALPDQKPVFPFALGLSSADPVALRRNLYPWIWANGGDIPVIDTSGEKPPLSKVNTETIAFLGQLNSENLLAPETFEKTTAQRLEEFAQGKIAMITASARDIAFLRRTARDITFGITAIPAAAPGKNRLGLSGIYAGINSDCALPDEAWTFLAFIAGKSNVFAEAVSAVPGSYPNVISGDYIKKDPLYSKARDIFEAADIIDYRPGQPFEAEINRIFTEKLAEAFK